MKLKDLFGLDDNNAYPMEQEDQTCCGKHEICKEGRRPRVSKKPVDYYDDEELDAFRNRSSDSYSEEETALFAEVLRTMWESDVAGWIGSLQQRGIELPDSLKDEVLLLLEG